MAEISGRNGASNVEKKMPIFVFLRDARYVYQLSIIFLLQDCALVCCTVQPPRALWVQEVAHIVLFLKTSPISFCFCEQI